MSQSQIAYRCRAFCHGDAPREVGGLTFLKSTDLVGELFCIHFTEDEGEIARSLRSVHAAVVGHCIVRIPELPSFDVQCRRTMEWRRRDAGEADAVPVALPMHVEVPTPLGRLERNDQTRAYV